MKFKILSIPIFIVALILVTHTKVYAQTNEPETIKGVVTEVNQQSHSDFGEYYQKLLVRLKGGNEIEVVNNPQNTARTIQYEKGDKVILQKLSTGSGEKAYTIIDYQRTGYIFFLFLLFAAVAIVVGKKHGVYSLFGMAFSFFMIFKFILPQIINGANPILITLIASLLIVPVTFYLSHGFNKKTHIAIASTALTLIVTVILTSISVNLAKLTGYSSEEALFLQVAKREINMSGILLAGIIIGFLGVLDDVTISQSSVVSQLKKSKRHYKRSELYNDAMNVGRDHITSMINTLVLVYSGASMPLLLLFINNPQPIMEVINREIIADEIIRTLVGSIGLILAVPLSTFIASNLADD